MEVPVLDGLQAPSPGGWRTIIRVPPLPISGFTEPDWPCTACQTLFPYSEAEGTLLCFEHHGFRRLGGSYEINVRVSPRLSHYPRGKPATKALAMTLEAVGPDLLGAALVGWCQTMNMVG